MTGNIALDFAADWTQKQLAYEAESIQKLAKYQDKETQND